MYLTKTIATEIIKEISPFLAYDLNIIDQRGLILASTDADRVNTCHEGARILIRENLSGLIVETDESYEGCKKGINLPIIFSKNTVGVVGITGDPQETIKYGQLIQKMCEMLIYETFEISQKSKEDQTKLLFVNDAIHGNLSDQTLKKDLKFKNMGLSKDGPFSAAVLKLIYQDEVKSNSELFNAKDIIIRSYLTDILAKSHVLAITNKNSFIALTNSNPETLHSLLEQANTSLMELYNISLFAAIGNEYQTCEEIPKSYQEACHLCSYLPQNQPGIYLFNTLALEFIIDQIPDIHKMNLSNQIFKNCNHKEIEEFCYFINSYFECSGSLNQLSARHYIHKNTVQYKINKLQKKTGKDLRISNDLFLLYLAAQYSEEN